MFIILKPKIMLCLLLMMQNTHANDKKKPLEVSDTDWKHIQSKIAPTMTYEESFIKPFNTDSNDFFGYTVAVFGETIVVGSPYEQSETTGINTSDGSDNTGTSGAAYVFVRENGNWVQQAYLKAQYSNPNLEFGKSVAISGNTIIIGAPGDNRAMVGVNSTFGVEEESNSGAAYVYTRIGDTWMQQADLKPSNTYIGSHFGNSVAIDNDTIIVGSYGEHSDGTSQNNDSLTNAGAAYVFSRTTDSWSQQAYLKPSNIDNDNQFGWCVDISGDSIVVGAFLEEGNNNMIDDAGAAYIFKNSGTIWQEQFRIEPSSINAGDNFGYSCAISSDVVMVGARHFFFNATQNAGAVFVFDRTGSSWSESQILSSNNGGNFGWSMAVNGDLAIIGARAETANTASEFENGAVYTYKKINGDWESQSQLTALNLDSYDFFGWSVGISESTIAVGAILEDSSTSGINPAALINGSSNENASDSGAVYSYYYSDDIFVNGFE